MSKRLTAAELRDAADLYAARAIESHIEDWLNEDGAIPEADEPAFEAAVYAIVEELETR